MPLSDDQIRRAWCDLAGEVEALGRFDKAQGTQIFQAVDAWIDANANSYNTALPAFFKGANSTSAEKAAVFMYVLLKRFRG